MQRHYALPLTRVTLPTGMEVSPMFRWFTLLSLFLALTACGGTEDTFAPQTGFVSIFRLQNNANYTVEVQYRPYSALSSDMIVQQIAAGDEREFFRTLKVTDDIDKAPTPESTFQRLIFIALDGNASYPAIDKLKDSVWAREEDDPVVNYTLSLTDTDFVFATAAIPFDEAPDELLLSVR
ncbi:hypothetical protein [Teredinibacter turnerae]|uniref:hypothetical protein n=1 Tax=Teredinibacter turnerae TaxID=2426 RepID=UPI001F08484F|nr:hypothetical protein [Teredinibacter turnerae]